MFSGIIAIASTGAFCLKREGWCIVLLLLLLVTLGCEGEQPVKERSAKKQSTKEQPDNTGLRLQIRLLSNPGSNKVEYVEEVVNMSDHSICFAFRKRNSKLVQIAGRRTVDGTEKLVHYSEPDDLSMDGYSFESSTQVVEGYSSYGRAYDGGEVIMPSETISVSDPPESFTINQAGLFRLQNELSVDILDEQKAIRHKVLGKYKLKSNELNLNITNDIQKGKKEKSELKGEN